MRINLKTPFAEKDSVKALGARWDAARKIWYITDVADLTPFMRWIPDLQAATEDSTTQASTQTASPTQNAVKAATAEASARQPSGVITQPAKVVPHCGCTTLPWLDCPHTTSAAG